MMNPAKSAASAVLGGLLLSLPLAAGAAPYPVTAIAAHYETVSDSSGDYVDSNGNSIRYGQGDDNLLFVDAITVRGNRMVPSAQADVVKAQRVLNNQCTLNVGCDVNGAGVTGEKLFFQYPTFEAGLAFDLAPPRFYSIEDVYLTNAINIAVDNPLSNLDNNVERVDIVFSQGLEVPTTAAERQRMGFMIPERWGNNPHQIAAIRAIDNANNPTAFYRLSKANINNYGNTQFTITHADGTVDPAAPFSPASLRLKNADNPVPGGVAGSRTNPLNGNPDFFLRTQQPIRASFHSFEQLGLPAGVTVYGFSMFGIDVTPTMDLVGLSDVPLDTDHVIEDSADIFGSIGSLYVAAGDAIVGIAKAVTDTRAISETVYDVDISLVVENLNTAQDALNVQVTDDLAATFAGAASFDVIDTPNVGRFTAPATPFDGDTNINLLAGTDTLPAGAVEIITFTVRVDITGSDGIFQNTAIATTATTPGGTPTGEDLSDEGTDPDPNGDGFPNGADEDDPTTILLGPDAGRITVDKSVGRAQASVGDLVSYRLLITNNGATRATDVQVQDTIPSGFRFVDDSALLTRAGADGEFDTADDTQIDIVPSGTNTLIFGPFIVNGNEQVRITYLLRVGAGVRPGEHNNVAVPYQGDDQSGPRDIAGVEIVRDSVLDQGTALGVVFHDRDRDGYQDSVAATRVRLQFNGLNGELVDIGNTRILVNEDQAISGSLAEGFVIDRIDGRAYESQSANLRQVEFRLPLTDNQLTEEDLTDVQIELSSAEGMTQRGNAFGNERTEEWRGQMESGVNNQRINFATRLESDEGRPVLVVTVYNDAIAEAGIPGVRLATVSGLLIETDANGRYHIADTDFIERGRGTQFILKVDPTTLPQGSQFTTENPRVLRYTNSVLNRINFGVDMPAQQLPVAEVERTIPAHTEMRDQKNIDFSTTFLDEGQVPPVRFESGKSNIDQTYVDQLKPVIEQMGGKENVKLSAIGHTDTVRLKPSTAAIYGDNQGLSEARARAVADFITQDSELSDLRVETEGRSFRDPVATNATEAGRALNRRVEVAIVFDESQERWVRVPVQVPEQTVIEERPMVEGGMLWATEDPAMNDPRLDIEADAPAMVEADGELASAVTFSVYTNYRYFIDRWELRTFAPGDRALANPRIAASGGELVPLQSILVNETGFGAGLRAGQQFSYVLRVYDAEGNWDETVAKVLPVVDAGEAVAARSPSRLRGQTALRVQSIPVRGSRVRIYGAAVSDQYAISLDGERLEADGNGAFISEQHMPVGERDVTLSYADNNGVTWERELPVEVTGDYLFMVGLANLTVGGNDANGMIEGIDEDDQFDDNSFVNARGAFYLKGKIQGKYLVTAQLDTREDEFKNLDDQLKRKDTTTLFRKLDPDRYYPVYGDDSTTYTDVDSQGAYYVRVDWDKSRALWGNFNTDITANEFAHYSRTLYGAQLVYRTPTLTTFGDHQNLLTAFASEAQSAAGHNQFRATGGSLYYLRETDLVVGSEKLWIEIRERNSTQVVERYSLRAGVDYEIDYYQGRIILSQPLSQIAQRMSPSIIQDRPLQGDDVYLLADYEYVPDDFNFDNMVAGVRGKTWLGDHVGIGATLIDEERDADDYTLRGVDVTLRASKGTYIKGEYAESDASQARGGFVSADGGLTFTEQSAAAGSIDREGKATGLEARVDIGELTDFDTNGEVSAWRKERDAGFSSSRDDTGLETRDQGVRGRWAVTPDLQLSARSRELETVGSSSDISHSVQLDGAINERWSAGVEVQRSEFAVSGAEDEDATLAGARVSYLWREKTTLYGKAQTVVESTDAYRDNEQYGAGISSHINDRLTLGGEVIRGDRGDGLVLRTDYLVSDRASVNVAAGFGDAADSQIGANYRMDNGLNLYGTYAETTADNNEEKSTLTVGQRKKFANATEVFFENQLSDQNDQAGLTHVFGVDHGLNDFLAVSLSLQKSTLEQDEASDISRNAATAGLRYKRDRLKASTRLEYRRDRATLNTTQWLTANALEWKQTRDYRWLGRLNHSFTNNDDTDLDEARFTEASIGFAYRPALNDRFNLLARLSYVYDLPSSGQNTTATDSRAWVLATEGAYALTPRWEVGGKVAGKKGEVRQQRATGPWFDSTARFYAARLRYHLLFEWDVLGEYRWLEAVEDETVRSGALVAVYRHLGDHVKLGLGFNFTDFNDDLTDLDYDNRGWFLDVTAKY